jgi:hypothetical protein
MSHLGESANPSPLSDRDAKALLARMVEQESLEAADLYAAHLRGEKRRRRHEKLLKLFGLGSPRLDPLPDFFPPDFGLDVNAFDGYEAEAAVKEHYPVPDTPARARIIRLLEKLNSPVPTASLVPILAGVTVAFAETQDPYVPFLVAATGAVAKLAGWLNLHAEELAKLNQEEFRVAHLRRTRAVIDQAHDVARSRSTSAPDLTGLDLLFQMPSPPVPAQDNIEDGGLGPSTFF